MPDIPSCCTAHLKQSISFVTHACTCRARVITVTPSDCCIAEMKQRSVSQEVTWKMLTINCKHRIDFINCFICIIWWSYVRKRATLRYVWMWPHWVRVLFQIFQVLLIQNKRSGILIWLVDYSWVEERRWKTANVQCDRSGASGFYVTVSF